MSFDINKEGNIVATSITNDDLKYDVKIYQKNTNTSLWEQIGETLIGDSTKALTNLQNTYPYGLFGKKIVLNGDGTRIAILGYYNYAEIYEYTDFYIEKRWVKIGSTISSSITDNTFEKITINTDGSIVSILENDPSDTVNSRIITYQYSSNTDLWSQLGQTINSSGRENTSIDLNDAGDILAIGDPTNKGTVKIYQYFNQTWNIIGQTFNGLINNEKLGKRVSLNKLGTRICINCENIDNKGLTKVYEYKNSVWTKLGNDIVGNLSQNLGNHIDINEDGNVITLITNDTTQSQKIYIYQYTNDDWSLVGVPLDVDTNNNHSEGLIKVNNIGNIVGYFYKQNNNYKFSIHEWPTIDTIVGSSDNFVLTDKISTSSNVGIGTTSPQSLLHISNDSGDSILRIETKAGNTKLAGIEFWTDDSTPDVAGNASFPATRILSSFAGTTYETSYLKFQTHHSDSTTYNDTMIIKGANVGIGTQIPNCALEVHGGAGSNDEVLILSNKKDDVASEWHSIFTLGGQHYDVYYNSTIQNGKSTSNGGSHHINYFSGGDVSLCGNGNGNVGIGTTTSTQAKLVVNGSSIVGIYSMGDYTDYNYILNSPRPGYTTGGAVHFINSETRTSDGGASCYTIRNDNGPIRLGRTDFGTTIEGSNIILDGNVGIGTTSPNAKLEIYDNTVGSSSTLILRRDVSTYGSSDDGAAIEFKTRYTGNSGDYKQTRIRGIDDNVGGQGSGSGGIAFDTYYVPDNNNVYTERMRISGAGDVGIGTTTPGYKLEVNGTAKLGETVTKYLVNHLSSGTGIWFDYANTIRFITNNSEKMIIKPDGNVGIGVSNPSDKLVVDTASAQTKVQFGIGGNDNSTVMYIGGGSGNQRKLALISEPEGGWCRSNLHFCLNTVGDASDVTKENDSKMVIKNNGNVGIGTTSPNGTLNVYKSGNGEGMVQFTSTSDMSMRLQCDRTGISSNDMEVYYEIMPGTTTTQTWKMGTNDDKNLHFRWGDIGSMNNGLDYLTILNTGNVGIGTTAPTCLFDVNGDAAIRGQFDIKKTGGTKTSHFNWGANGDIYLRSSETAGKIILQDDGGNVGIGTDSPDAPLKVVKKGSAGTIAWFDCDTAGNSGISSCAKRGSDGDGYIELVGGNSTPVHGKHVYIGATRNGNDTYNSNMVFKTRHSELSYEYHTAAERMRIQYDGNVGIGTTSPAYPLHVNGTIGIGVRTDWGAPILQHTPYVSEDYFSIGFSDGTSSGTQNAGKALNVLRKGNVGIGTTSPTEKLEVNGNIKADKILYSNVFSTENDLPSATTYHGMFTHVHGTGRAYFSHGGNWHKLVDESSSNGTITATSFIGDGSGLTGLPEPDLTLYAVSASPTFTGTVSIGTATPSFTAITPFTQLGGDIDGEAANDKSGECSLSGDGTTLAIGAYWNDAPHDPVTNDNKGHVRVFRYANSAWTQLGSDIDGEGNDDWFGKSVSMNQDGTIVAIGALYNDGNGSNAGHVRVYQYQSSGGVSAWVKMGSDIDGEAASDYFGNSVSLNDDGTIVAIGGVGNGAGHVRVFQYANSAWTQLGGDIVGEAVNDYSGHNISLNSNGTIVAIGAYSNDDGGNNAGHVRVYQYSNNTWTKLGNDIDGEAEGDRFGERLSLSSDGTIFAAGARYNDGTDTNDSRRGHVRVFQYTNNAWTQIGADIDGENSLNPTAGDQSYIVSLSGDGTIVAIGGMYNDQVGGKDDAGHVRIYQWRQFTQTDHDNSIYHYTSRIQSAYENQEKPLIITENLSTAPVVGQKYWTQIGLDINGEAGYDGSGMSVSLSSDGTKVAIGAEGNDGANNSSATGHVRVYKLGEVSAGSSAVSINDSTGTVTATAFVGDVMKMKGITTDERNALTAEAGMIIFNSTDNKHQAYNGTSWNNLY